MIFLQRNTVGISSFFAQKSSLYFYLKMDTYVHLMKGILIMKTNLVRLSILNHMKKLYAKINQTLISIELIETIER
jgi:hypothetical protein